MGISYSTFEEEENFIHNKFGYCFYILGDIPLIYNLYVYPKYRRCGHSRTLLQCVISEIRQKDYEGVIHIQAIPREDSIKLANLEKYYESMGLIILKERDNQ